MPIIRKNILFHSYPMLSRKRVISFHSCFKFFKTGSPPPIYFLDKILFSLTIPRGAFRIFYIWFMEVVQVMTVCIFKVFHSAFTMHEGCHQEYVYFLLQQGRLWPLFLYFSQVLCGPNQTRQRRIQVSWRLLGQGKRCLVCLADSGFSVTCRFVTQVF